MDTMTNGEETLKDTSGQMDIAVKDKDFIFSFSKINKLIAALYMVTDVMDKDEPLRLRLRLLGTEIISDIHSSRAGLPAKISQVLSLLDVAHAVNLVSEMNAGILKKEFFEIKRSIEESAPAPILLSELFAGSESSLSPAAIGHARIGVQKGGTLMRALSQVKVPDSSIGPSDKVSTRASKNKNNVLKEGRRNQIINIIKKNSNGVSIKEIVQAIGQGEKTVQRELASMVKDNMLYRTGSKRWTRYFIKK